MIFVDANVVMYAVGKPNPAQSEVHQRFADLPLGELATSAEVMQELMYRYVRAQRWTALDRALALVNDRMAVWPIEADDVMLARRLVDRHPSLSARDLLHLATCMRHSATELWTYDRGLAAAWRSR